MKKAKVFWFTKEAAVIVDGVLRPNLGQQIAITVQPFGDGYEYVCGDWGLERHHDLFPTFEAALKAAMEDAAAYGFKPRDEVEKRIHQLSKDLKKR